MKGLMAKICICFFIQQHFQNQYSFHTSKCTLNCTLNCIVEILKNYDVMSRFIIKYLQNQSAKKLFSSFRCFKGCDSNFEVYFSLSFCFQSLSQYMYMLFNARTLFHLQQLLKFDKNYPKKRVATFKFLSSYNHYWQTHGTLKQSEQRYSVSYCV